MIGQRQRSARPLVSLALVLVTLLSTVGAVTAQTGADVAVSITGNRQIRIGQNITYTITGTNVGEATATDVQLDAGVPDWFDFVSADCLTGSPGAYAMCAYGDLAPGGSVSMTITLTAVAGNKAERHMYEGGAATASNDVNTTNDYQEIPVIMTGPCRNCPNK